MKESVALRLFISYAHADQYFHKRLIKHLVPLEQAQDCAVEAWSDRHLKPGSHWEEKIEEAIDKADVAILLISADFLASEFIQKKELPLLLTKAKADNNATILPLIIGPSLFDKTNELAAFQAVNNPAQPLECLSKGEQERVFAELAHLIAEISSAHKNQALSSMTKEVFEDAKTWPRLLKYGKWDYRTGVIVGSEVGSFLLSEKEYGEKDFLVETTLQFADFDKPTSNPAIGMNAGIVFGWLAGYFNILLTGSGVAIERLVVSGSGMQRSGHLTKIVPLDITPNQDVRIKVQAGSSEITVLVNDSPAVSVARTDNIRGRVGLRAWRSTLTCKHFEVADM